MVAEAAAKDEDDEDDDDIVDRNNRRVGDDRWCGDTLPPSLSLDVDEGGVGGSEKPTEGPQEHQVNMCNMYTSSYKI